MNTGEISTYTRPKVRSFDLFDTLLARWGVTPDSVFEEMERISGVSGFVNIRKNAERSASPIRMETIYAGVQQALGCTDAYAMGLRELEERTEERLTYRIERNARLATDGIVVSDFYYDREALLKLLCAKAMRPVDLFVSYDGKRSGRIWTEILDRYDVVSHIGDNFEADVKSPIARGIHAEWFSASSLSVMELELKSRGLAEVAHLSRACRLSNPYGGVEREVYGQQAEINIPLLVLFAEYIARLAAGHNRVAFIQRDGCHLQGIYGLLHPEKPLASLYASREAFRGASPTYQAYFRGIVSNGTLLVDLQGTGRTLAEFAGKVGVFPTYLTLIDPIADNSVYGKKMSVVQNGSFRPFTDKVESLNYDLTGRTRDVVDGHPVRAEVEYPTELVKVQHEAVRRAMDFLREHDCRVKIATENIVTTIAILLTSLEYCCPIREHVTHVP